MIRLRSFWRWVRARWADGIEIAGHHHDAWREHEREEAARAIALYRAEAEAWRLRLLGRM